MKKNKTTSTMANLFILIFVVIFLTLSGRFLYIQATGEIQGIDLQEWADDRRTNNYAIEANRGTIYDRNGMDLAQDRATYSLYAIVDEAYSTNLDNPKHVDNVDKTAEALAPLLDMEVAEVKSVLQTGIENDKFQVEFGANGSQLSQEVKLDIEALDLPGINFDEEAKRYYPNGTFASQIIGLAQKNDDSIITGITGIEAQLDDYLQGTNGSISYKRDKYNTKLLDPDEIIQEEEDGDNVYLTIDQKIQTFLEDAMSQVVEDYNPARITATVIDPKTGEILAMSNRPSYNPNDLENVENWYNDVVSTPIEPGSTMKAFTLAAAIEEGVYNGDELYESGSYKIDEIEKPITDYNQSWGLIPFDEGIRRSSNVAVSKLVWEKMGTETFLEYLNAFHFDQNTGIDLPREQAGTILYNYTIEKLTTAYGQGSTVTPIQLIQAATALANDGNMMKPYVISKITDSETGQIVEETESEVVGNPISEETANQVLDILETVVTEEDGTAHNIYNLSDYSVAGKTGTAQLSQGGYLTGANNYIFSFLGMAPKEDPELIMYITVQQPELEVGEAGSAPVSYIFKNVMENSLHYLNIQPDKEEQETVATYTFPEVIGESVDEVKANLEENDLKVTMIGNGESVTASSVTSGEKVVSGEHILLVTDNPTMPNITGWSLRNVIELGELVDLDLEYIGSGYATSQSVKTGSDIGENTYMMVEFSPPENTEEESEDESEEETTSEND
ncbi:penicillin-binding protein [Paraliobacillus zengyii]|uniref:penicillin-binding protein n=1 Tax=Paraliobacillus zengyii TaxID=2213194 RepID=UPI0039FC6CDD